MKHTIIRLPETNSTSSYLRILQQERRQPEGCVVVADSQTAGRGQMGNSWEAENGKNLTFSVLFYPSHVCVSESFILSQAVSLAVVETFEVFGEDFRIKWPNDIYWREKKIGGILIENDLNGKFLDTSIVGIGLNINQEKFVSNAPNPVSLNQITGQEYPLPAWLDDVCCRIMQRYEQTRTTEGQKEIECRYMGKLFRREGFFPFRDKGGIFNARIERIEPSGHLVLKRDDGTTSVYAFKEVEFLF